MSVTFAESIPDGLLTSKPHKAPRTGLLFDFADEVADAHEAQDELVEGVLTRGAMSTFYGDSNSGKTFLAIDLGCAVARGAKWMGRSVERGLVVYLAVESPQSVQARMRAYQRQHGVKVPNFVIVKSPVNLFDGQSDAEAVVKLVQSVERQLGVKCELIIGDTLARLSAGANENSGADMGKVVTNIDDIRRQCGAHFLLVHHSGKDAARGMRGWSGLRAAIDTEVEVTDGGAKGVRCAEITKQRDLAGKGVRIGFRLETVQQGTGKWGKVQTSCVVVPADPLQKEARAKRPSEIAGSVVEVLTACGSGVRKADLVKDVAERLKRPDGSSSVYRELKKMTEAGMLAEAAGVITLIKQPQVPSSAN